MPGERQILEEIFMAGVRAVAPDGAIGRHVRLEGDALLADGKKYALAGRRIRLLGAGKGAAPMAARLEDLLGNRLDGGLIVVKYGHDLPLKRIKVLQAAHPVPDEAGEGAAREMLRFAQSCRPDDLLICVITGGASALMAASPIGLEDFRAVTDLLLRCGAPIADINVVRKHLSSISGGQLAAAANGAEILGLIISDVIGDSLDSIASGPTVPDASTYGDALAVLKKWGIAEKAPKSVPAYLQRGARGGLPETPKPGQKFWGRVGNILCATNAQALEAAAKKAQELGFKAKILTDSLAGEARDVACELCRTALMEQKHLTAPLCLLAGGETTVTIRGHGLGGRNQEMALAASIFLAGAGGICALFGGTDGTDGPTEAAGGFAFADNVDKMGGRACEYLEDNAGNAALSLANALLITGPTLTNVMDMAVILVKPVDTGA